MKRMFSFLTLLGLVCAPHLASAYYDPGVQRWINRDPVQEAGGPNLFAFVSNESQDLVDPLGLCDCKGMRNDIDGFEQVRQKLQGMFMSYSPGQTLANYGLSVAATTGGYRSPDFAGYADCTREVIEAIERDSGFTIAATLYQSIVGFAGYYTFGLHGVAHGTTADEQSGLTFIRIEQARNRLLLNLLKKKFADDCTCLSSPYRRSLTP